MEEIRVLVVGACRIFGSSCAVIMTLTFKLKSWSAADPIIDSTLVKINLNSLSANRETALNFCNRETISLTCPFAIDRDLVLNQGRNLLVLEAAPKVRSRRIVFTTFYSPLRAEEHRKARRKVFHH